MKYYKIVNPKGHYGMVYKDGINVDILPFNPTGSCQEGGLYFTTIEYLFGFLTYGSDVYQVWPVGEVHEEVDYITGNVIKRKAHSLKMKRLGEWKDIKVFKKLIDNGANPYYDNNYAFLKSSEQGYGDIVKYYIEHCMIDANAYNSVAIYDAFAKKNVDLVKFLILHGSYTANHRYGKHPIIASCIISTTHPEDHVKYFELFKYIRTYAVDRRSTTILECLEFAIIYNNMDVVKYCIRSKTSKTLDLTYYAEKAMIHHNVVIGHYLYKLRNKREKRKHKNDK